MIDLMKTHSYIAAMPKEYTDEAKLLKDTKDYLAMIDACLPVRIEATTHSGISDIIVCFKGKFVAIELKDDIGEPTLQQEQFIEKVIKSGGIAGIARNLTDVFNLLIKAY